MIFEKLVLRDDPLFGNAEIEFKPGVTVVYGLNKLSTASRNGNFAGKSYLLSQVPETIWDTQVVGTREDKNKLGKRELYVRIGDNRYCFSKGTKQEVSLNGNLLFKNVRDTKAWVSSLPISEDEFLGLYYLDSRRMHPLVMGTSSERAAYLTKFFHLDRIDAERKLINARLSEIKGLRAKLEEVESSIQTLRGNRPAGTKIDVKSMSLRLAQYQKKQRRFSLWQRASDLAVSLRPQLRAVRDILDLTDPEQLSTKNIRALIKSAKAALNDDLQVLKTARAYEEYKKQRVAYDKATAKLTPKQLEALPRIEELRKAYQKYQALDLPDVPAPPTPPKPVKDTKANIEELRASVDRLQHELDHANKFKRGVCPTCGSAVKARPKDKIKEELRPLLKKLESAKRKRAEFNQYQEDMVDYKLELRKWKGAKLEHTKINKKKKLLRKDAQLYKALRNIPEKPAPFHGKKLQLEVVESMVDRDKEVLYALTQVLPNVKLLRALSNPPKDFSKKIEKLHEALARASAEATARASYRRQMKELLARRESLAESLRDEPALQLLAQAYNEKGMKRLAIEAVTSLLEQQLNKYSPMVFPDNYKFSAHWEKSKLSIQCHRPSGKVKTTDVRKLSGAESRLFTYLLVFAQLQFVPKQSRSNLMILDEPTTNMHPETAESFKSALKLLQSIIPSIVVITPQSSEFYDGARSLTVVRSKGISKIVEGHPQTL